MLFRLLVAIAFNGVTLGVTLGLTLRVTLGVTLGVTESLFAPGLNFV